MPQIVLITKHGPVRLLAAGHPHSLRAARRSPPASSYHSQPAERHLPYLMRPSGNYLLAALVALLLCTSESVRAKFDEDTLLPGTPLQGSVARGAVGDGTARVQSGGPARTFVTPVPDEAAAFNRAVHAGKRAAEIVAGHAGLPIGETIEERFPDQDFIFVTPVPNEQAALRHAIEAGAHFVAEVVKKLPTSPPVRTLPAVPTSPLAGGAVMPREAAASRANEGVSMTVHMAGTARGAVGDGTAAASVQSREAARTVVTPVPDEAAAFNRAVHAGKRVAAEMTRVSSSPRMQVVPTEPRPPSTGTSLRPSVSTSAPPSGMPEIPSKQYPSVEPSKGPIAMPIATNVRSVPMFPIPTSASARLTPNAHNGTPLPIVSASHFLLHWFLLLCAGSSCVDVYERDKCRIWASNCECQINPVFMHRFCRGSCSVLEGWLCA